MLRASRWGFCRAFHGLRMFPDLILGGFQAEFLQAMLAAKVVSPPLMFDGICGRDRINLHPANRVDCHAAGRGGIVAISAYPWNFAVVVHTEAFHRI
jgi:hypothetical protein